MSQRTCNYCAVPLTPENARLEKYEYVCTPCRGLQAKLREAEKRAAGAPPIRHRMRSTKWTPETREQKRERSRIYHAKPETRVKEAARKKLLRAVRKGRITRQPCATCGDPKVQAHHEDYAKPLDVIWLCQKCHSREHFKEKIRPAEYWLARIESLRARGLGWM